MHLSFITGNRERLIFPTNLVFIICISCFVTYSTLNLIITSSNTKFTSNLWDTIKIFFIDSTKLDCINFKNYFPLTDNIWKQKLFEWFHIYHHFYLAYAYFCLVSLNLIILWEIDQRYNYILKSLCGSVSYRTKSSSYSFIKVVCYWLVRESLDSTCVYFTTKYWAYLLYLLFTQVWFSNDA